MMYFRKAQFVVQLYQADYKTNLLLNKGNVRNEDFCR